MKSSLRNSTLLKILSICIIPMAIIIITLNIFYLYVSLEEPDILKMEHYANTNWFADTYVQQLERKVRHVKSDLNYDMEDNNQQYSDTKSNIDEAIVANTDERNSYHSGYYYTYYDFKNPSGEVIHNQLYSGSTGFYYLFINEKTGEAYTNIKLTSKEDSIQDLKNRLQELPFYLNYKESEQHLDTNIEHVSFQEIDYSYQSSQMKPDFEIYSSFTGEALLQDGGFYEQQLLFDVAKQISDIPYIVVTPIMCVLLVLAIVYLCLAIGHKKGEEGIYLNWFDKLPLEIVVIFIIICWCVGIAFIGSNYSYDYTDVIAVMIGIIVSTFFIYLTVLAGMGTIIKRIKARRLIKTTLIYKIISAIRKLLKNIFENFNLTMKLVVIYGSFLLISALLILVFQGFGVFLNLIFWSYIFVLLLNRVKAYVKIKGAIKNIYNGVTDQKLDETMLKGSLREVAVYVNDIAGGFSNAVEESLKSERMKTELITNVSHDIKTPLTSIINYVDLLKKEEIENEKAKEYIEILDNKSQRLKKLTDDLVEAAKASSGNVKLNKEKINLTELMKQTTGEFEDRFHEKELDIIANMPEEVNVMADSRYMFRIIENLFSNISKYALEGSRVYIDMIKSDGKVYIGIKNISKQKLNISVEELMQRFVRGDKSRNTEGSGLGLSISKSLTELQGGKFNMKIDGDLFKIELEFNII